MHGCGRLNLRVQEFYFCTKILLAMWGTFHSFSFIALFNRIYLCARRSRVKKPCRRWSIFLRKETKSLKGFFLLYCYIYILDTFIYSLYSHHPRRRSFLPTPRRHNPIIELSVFFHSFYNTYFILFRGIRMFSTIAYGRINHTMSVIATTSVSIIFLLYDFLQLLRFSLYIYI